MKSSKFVYLPLLLLIAIFSILPAPFQAQTTSNPQTFANVMVLTTLTSSSPTGKLTSAASLIASTTPKSGSSTTVSEPPELLDSNANFEEFDVTSTDKKLRIKAQTLRLYNATSRQWSIYLVDVDNGTSACPPWWVSLPAIAASFSIRKTSKAEPFWCVTSGSTSLPTQRAWSSRSRRMAGRPGGKLDLRAFAITNGTLRLPTFDW